MYRFIYFVCYLHILQIYIHTCLATYVRTDTHTHIYIYIYTPIYICDKKDQRDFFRNETRSRGLLKARGQEALFAKRKESRGLCTNITGSRGYLKRRNGLLTETFRYYCWLIQKQRCKLWCEAGFWNRINPVEGLGWGGWSFKKERRSRFFNRTAGRRPPTSSSCRFVALKPGPKALWTLNPEP